MYVSLHVNYPLFLPDFNETRTLSTDYRKILKSNVVKIRPVGAELSHADSRTDEQREADKCDEANIPLFILCERA
jgi:hypothetical protein